MTDLKKNEPGTEAILNNSVPAGFKWYIAKAQTGQENKVMKSLKENIINYKMTEFFAEVIVPEESVVTTANGKKKTIKRNFFLATS